MTPCCGGYAYFKQAQLDDWGICAGTIGSLTPQLKNETSMVQWEQRPGLISSYTEKRASDFLRPGTPRICPEVHVYVHESVFMLTKRPPNWLLGARRIRYYGINNQCNPSHDRLGVARNIAAHVPAVIITEIA